jgi:hypothetical protein
MRANHRIELDNLCPHPDLGWLTTYRILRACSQPGSIERKAAKQLRLAIASLIEDPNGPTGCLHIAKFFNILGMTDKQQAALTCYADAIRHMRLPMPEVHTTRTPTYHPEFCVPSAH